MSNIFEKAWVKIRGGGQIATSERIIDDIYASGFLSRGAAEQFAKTERIQKLGTKLSELEESNNPIKIAEAKILRKNLSLAEKTALNLIAQQNLRDLLSKLK